MLPVIGRMLPVIGCEDGQDAPHRHAEISFCEVSVRCVCRVPACFSGRGAASRSRRRALASPSAPRAHSSLHADGTIGALFHYERCGLQGRAGRCALPTDPRHLSSCMSHTHRTASETKNEEVAFLHPQRGKAQATLESNVTKQTFLQRHPHTGLRAGDRAGRARAGCDLP